MSEVEAELEEIETVLSQRPDDYFRDSQMQARYSELISAQEYGTAVSGVDRNAERIAAIESEMRAPMNTSKYWESSPEGERMRQEYADLLEAPPSPRDAVAGREPTLADALGLDAETVASVEERVSQAFANVDMRDLDESWNGLSPMAQLGWAQVLADPAAVLRDQATVDAFADAIGDAAFSEILNFEAAMSADEKAALRRACLVD